MTYYVAINGQQQGPYSLNKLEAMRSSGQLNATDLCWSEGMADWQPLSTALPSLAISQPAAEFNPYAPPKSMDVLSTFTQKKDYYGGIGRLAYVGWSFGLNLIVPVLATVLQDSALMFVILLGLIVGSIVIVCQRLKNIGMSQWAAFLVIVPIANIWIGYRLLACQEGYQDIGRLDKAGRIISWIFGGLIVLMVGCAILVAAMGDR